jgi:hypothetical protein
MISKSGLKTYLLIVLVFLISMAGNAKADFTFGTPMNLGPVVNSEFGDFDSHVLPNGLSLVFASDRPGGSGLADLYVTTRNNVTDPWGSPTNLGPSVNSSAFELDPSLSEDELTLVFVSSRSGSSGFFDIWGTTRSTIDAPWARPENLGLVNSGAWDMDPSLSQNGLELYFCSDRSDGHGLHDIWIATRETLDAEWRAPVNLSPTINTSDSDQSPCVSADGLMLFFSRGMSYSDADLWAARRNTVDGTWGEPKNLGPVVNIMESNTDPDVSTDGLWLFWNSSNTPDNNASLDLYQAPILPVVDFNGDGIVDANDMFRIVDHWGKDEPLCDIGPMPWGDGVVDVQDLIILSEHFFENVNDPTLVAHWALDEIEGMTALDNVSGNNDIVMGDPLWQPTGGKVNGALELDGIDDCIISSTSPNPTEETFSIVTWIKGGEPIQVIISQPVVADVLALDAEGNLMTGLNVLGQTAVPLLSKASLTDGRWHRIGLVWNGSRRALFVDSVKVAEDTEDGQGVFGSGLYIGVGKNYAPGTFFSGLIDDVRIYNRVVSP